MARRTVKRGTSAMQAMLSLPMIAAGSWIAYSNAFIDHHLPLPKAIDVQLDTFSSQTTGECSYYVDRSVGGRPTVFIHSVNAAASSYEFMPLFKHYQGRRPLYALDLPGFGFSSRANRVYTPQRYQDAITDFLSSQVGGPADIVALSLGCEFAALAAQARPDLVHSLTMISPSGFSSPGNGTRPSQEAGRRGAGDALHLALSFPLWGRALYDLIATRRSIEYFLQQSFVETVPTGMIDYAYATSHQPGAQHAPLRFISGLLFTRDIREKVYEKLTLPILVIHDRDAFVSFDMLPGVLERRSNWRTARITPTLGLPQFERLPDTVRALDLFWQATD